MSISLPDEEYKLNEVGNEGWEIVAASFDHGVPLGRGIYGTRVTTMLKRPKPKTLS